MYHRVHVCARRESEPECDGQRESRQVDERDRKSVIEKEKAGVERERESRQETRERERV